MILLTFYLKLQLNFTLRLSESEVLADHIKRTMLNEILKSTNISLII